jgi:hypothetical protein
LWAAPSNLAGPGAGAIDDYAGVIGSMGSDYACSMNSGDFPTIAKGRQLWGTGRSENFGDSQSGYEVYANMFCGFR